LGRILAPATRLLPPPSRRHTKVECALVFDPQLFPVEWCLTRMPPLAATDSGRPLFLLGTGRCGSTFWQTLLCRTADIWIWGEHGGMLRPFANSRRLLRDCEAFGMHAGRPVTTADIDQPTAESSPGLAWANGFDAAAFDDHLRGFIAGLMQPGLPPGKTRWGFKEIQYGDRDKMPELLLELFPGGTVVHTLRHPRSTFESAIRAWYPTALERAAADPADARAAYMEQSRRWLGITQRLLDLAESTGRVVSVRIEDVPGGRERLRQTLGVTTPESHPRVNCIPESRAATPAWLELLFEQLWQESEDKLQPVAARAGYA
ncbi:MAG: sulfotransferase, partial [Pirellulales bacterium]